MLSFQAKGLKGPNSQPEWLAQDLPGYTITQRTIRQSGERSVALTNGQGILDITDGL
jgi:hypothetical protein